MMRTGAKLSLFLLVVALSSSQCGASNSASESDTKSQVKKTFIATKEWQTIQEGQAIPRGLHVRMNLATGLKEAKLLDEREDEEVNEPSTSALTNVATETEESKDDNVTGKLDREELKLALKKIKNLAPEASIKSKNFRTYDEIKKEMEEVQQKIKTEGEIVRDLIASYATLPENKERLRILNDLEYYMHQFDNAVNFVDMGGFGSIVVPALNSTDDDIRSAAALLLGSACQSNPKVQIAAVEAGALPLLIRLMLLDSSIEVKNRALYSISSIVRNFPLAQKELIAHGGITALASVFSTDSADLLKMQLKIATLLSDLISERKSAVSFDDARKSDEGELSKEEVKERAFYAEKRRQYDAINVEKALVEQGFCQLLPRLLTQLRPDDKQTRREDLSSFYGRPLRQEHDVVEKVLQSMLSLSEGCHSLFRDTRQVIRLLTDRYENLSIQEKSEGETEPEADMYYTRLHSICLQLSTALNFSRSDEL